MKNMKVMSLMTNQLLKEGCKKSVYTSSNNDRLVLAFRDTLESVQNSGILWNLMNEQIFQLIQGCGVPNHYIKRLNLREHEVHNVSPFPFYVRITNIVTQPIHAVFNLELGTLLPHPLIEFMARQNDTLTVIEQGYLNMFDWCKSAYLDSIRSTVLRVNDILRTFFFHFQADIAQCTLRFGLFEPQYALEPTEKVLLINDLSPQHFTLWNKRDHHVFEMDRSLAFALAEYMKVNTSHCIDKTSNL